MMKSLLRAALVMGLLLAATGVATAKEPVEQFLEKLRERELFDAAEWYLESLKTNPNIDAETKQIIPYEQARVIVEMSKNERITTERLKKLDAAKLLFADFLKNNAAHSYANLARVQLGNLLIERAKAFVSQAEREKKPEEKKKIQLAADAEFKAARKELEQAVKDFDAAVKKFPAFVPKDQPDVRKKKNDARRDLIEASMYLGNCIYQHSQAFDKDGKERKQYLTEAGTAFHKIYNDFRTVFAGMYAGIWEARCFQEQGELSRALGLYLEIMSVEANDENVRGLKVKALRMAMEAWNDATQKKYAESIERGEAFLRAAHGDDDDTSDGLAVKYLVSQAMDLTLDDDKKTDPKAAKADPTKKANKLTDIVKARYVSSIKKYTADVIRGRSDYRKAASELMAKHGKLDPNALPTTFADAFDQAKAKFSVWQSTGEIAADTAKPPEERTKAAADSKTAADDAIRLLRLSLELKEREKTVAIEDVSSIRYYLTFLYYSLEHYHEAALQGEFLARNYPQFSAANHAGFIAMAAWIYLYNDAPAVNGKKLFETGNLVRVAELLTAKWPNTPYADNAWLMLADIRIREQDYEEAAKFLEKISDKSERRPDADLKHGQALWSQYLTFMRMQTPPPADQLKALIDKAEGLFKKGIEAKRKSIADSAGVEFGLLAAELSMAQLQVSRGTDAGAKAAIETLTKKDGFLPIYKAGSRIVTPPLSLEAHKVLLRAYVTSRNIAEAKKILTDLDKMFVGEGAAAARANFYRALGQEISQQLKTAPPTEQEALESAFHEFTATLTAKPADLDDNMLIWAAESNLGIGEAALKRGASAKPKVKELCSGAAELYKMMIERKRPIKDAAAAAAAPALAAANAMADGAAKQEAIRKAEAPVKKAENDITVLIIRLARAQRLAQNYNDAFETLRPMLLANDNILDAQFEMCEVFLDWGADTDSKRFAPARAGVPSGARKPIWGLALISSKLQPFVKDPNDPKETDDAKQRREEYRRRFFEAYLLYSRSYLLHAGKPDAASQKTKLLEAGANRIQTLWNLYSDELEKSKEWYEAYDKVLKDLQRAQGQDPSGLKGLPKPMPKKAAETTSTSAPASK